MFPSDSFYFISAKLARKYPKPISALDKDKAGDHYISLHIRVYTFFYLSTNIMYGSKATMI